MTGGGSKNSTTGEPTEDTYKVIGERPLVYSAWHSHASYPNIGLHMRSETYYAANDRTASGTRWNGNAQVIGIETSLTPHGVNFPQPDWLRWVGRWGSSEDHWYNLDQSLSSEGPGTWQPPGDSWSKWSTLYTLPAPYFSCTAAANLGSAGLLGFMSIDVDEKHEILWLGWTQQDPRHGWTNSTVILA